MTNPHDRIEEGRRLLAEKEAATSVAERASAILVLEVFFARHADYFLHTLPSELEAAHARIAALEEVLETAESWLSRWAQHVGRCRADACTCGLTAVLAEVTSTRASCGEEDGPHLADILDRAESIPTPAQAEDVVERVAEAILDTRLWPGAFRSEYPGHEDECEDARNEARAALSALPLDRNRIREIRERHAERERLISVSILPPSDANADVGFLLQQIANLGDENGD